MVFWLPRHRRGGRRDRGVVQHEGRAGRVPSNSNAGYSAWEAHLEELVRAAAGVAETGRSRIASHVNRESGRRRSDTGVLLGIKAACKVSGT